MFRKALQIVSVVCLTGLCVLYPVIEPLDPWDSKEPSSDAEIQFIAMLTFLGIMLVLARFLVTLAISPVLLQMIPNLRQRAGAGFAMHGFAFDPLATASPPIPLRI